MVDLSSQAVDNLQAKVRGQIITPSSANYDELREIWNAMIDRRPALIVRCSGAADVMQAVRFARQHQLLTSVRGAGHNIAGKSLHDGALLIDLGAMNTVWVDPEAKIAVAGPGAMLGDVDHETQAYGLAVPTGINSTTGIAGLTLGGGFGWTSRSLGLTADNLIAAEVVTAEGEQIRCDENSHPDLFWAIRGGGGNFGVVTSFKFKLHTVGPEVMSGPIVFPFDQASSVLHKYREFCASCPEELTVWAVMRDAPPLPFLPPEVHGTKVLILPALYNGPLNAGKKALAALKKLGQPIGDGFGAYPYTGFQQAFDPLLTPGARNYWKSHNFTELSDELIGKLIDYASKLPSAQSEIFIAQMGGATNRISPDATAYPHRDVEFIMNVHTRWDTADQDNACVSWAREFYAATEPFATGGVYVNFISEGDDSVRSAYGNNYDRLSRVKSKYDPDNFFRLNQNVRPD
ncbi:FAD-binding oxidoreductase [Lacisediminimonas profundi]|uniref:FAD-binding oxidoreductase n=1 Tax=Lacisediminimonas profundi TaxID=2603856 RepID=UPI00124AF6D7|nr:FAD-binding oxidoreductase [Lacisediminimonas profundi]